jgi:hypothetical protein
VNQSLETNNTQHLSISSLAHFAFSDLGLKYAHLQGFQFVGGYTLDKNSEAYTRQQHSSRPEKRGP